MKMKNRELIVHIDHLNEIVGEEKRKTAPERFFSGRVNLLMVRNLRAMYKEYSDNYEKDLNELHSRFYTTKETDVTIPADEENGIEEHTEKRTVEALKPDYTQEQYNEELSTLLELEVSVLISMIRPEDVEKVPDFETLDKLDFMIE